MQVQLDQYFSVAELHVAASLLDPRLKDNAAVLTQQQTTTAEQTVREMLSNWLPETERSIE